MVLPTDRQKESKNRMNRSALALLIVAVVMAVAGCKPALDINRNNAIATATPAKEAYDAAAIEAEITKLEREWADANKTHNSEPAKRILADNAVIVYPDGSTATKADEVKTIESGSITADSFEILDPKVTVVDGDSAFITGRGVIKNGKNVIPGQKRPIDISGEYRFLDVYAKRDGKWQVVASQATKILTPGTTP
jgi:Domain of unknown function (DUF4440)